MSLHEHVKKPLKPYKNNDVNPYIKLLTEINRINSATCAWIWDSWNLSCLGEEVKAW